MRIGQRRLPSRSYLDGQCLVAMPGMGDNRFSKTVVYVCAHSEDGAMGIILNRRATDMNFPDLLVQLGVVGKDDAISLPRSASRVPVIKGGPVETGRGFVLHSADFFAESSLPIDDGVCLTATLDILRAMASGEGPLSAVLSLGYAGWGAGQLESEIQSNAWLHCPADSGLIFDPGMDRKYEKALAKLGVDHATLSAQAGRG
jgi:putative transcriptional regulator